ncbi:hypothetical protein B0A52_01993 [Exophiala mesophila]|uniref:Cupin type-2 domain-containing protein n=1 Tax=Exophiala mesophila TaxID=212818 RepID=A0A438NEK5_EXOME|nr:hypothetical protein B0A52_01993 [Exophiala mesophila]
MTTNRTPTPVAGLPLLKRHIASHDANGKSIYTTSPAQQFIAIPGVGGLARSYSVSGVPATLTDDADLKAYLSSDANQVTSWTQPNIVTPNGVNLLIVDLEPGGVSQMHRTVSIDFSVCVMGTILHELDSGETVTLKPGDHIVQRGTNHRWHNASKTEPARFVATTVSCIPFDIAGKPLEEHHAPVETEKKDGNKL